MQKYPVTTVMRSNLATKNISHNAEINLTVQTFCMAHTGNWLTLSKPTALNLTASLKQQQHNKTDSVAIRQQNLQSQ